MKMQIGKWGNSLAVRLPRELVETFNLKEGDSIDSDTIKACLTTENATAIAERRAKAFEEIRKRRWPLPADWKFDREEANAR